MTWTELALILLSLLSLIAAWWQFRGWLKILPVLAGGLVLDNLLQVGYQRALLPVYVLIFALILIDLVQGLRKPASWSPSKIGLILGGVGSLLGGLLLVLAVLTTITTHPQFDLSRMSWSSAFRSMHAELAKAYAFGDWKAIDWDGIYAQFAPRIANAEQRSDPSAYYQALLGYTASIPDGHVWLEGDDQGTRQQALGGGYGLRILGLDDGRVVATYVDPNGPAGAAGIQWGAQIVTWNGLPIDNALAQTPAIWPKRRGAPATLEGLRLEQYRLLVRAAIGTRANLSFQNPESAQIQQTMLTAVADGEPVEDANVEPFPVPVEPGVILPGGYGYLKINIEDDNDGQYQPASAVKTAIEYFVAQQVPGVILDVRGNRGGSDEMVTQFVGYFFKERTFYERITNYFEPLDRFITIPPELWIEPLQPYYGGPVVVLIDNACYSSGEGIPLAISRLPQGTVMGFYGTYGSFGMTGGLISLPDSLSLHYPIGQSLNAQGVIQLDSDAGRLGGVAPTVRVPLTLQRAREWFVDGEDVLLSYAIAYLDHLPK
jgi:carboxyl-terminal processing protease